MLTLLFGVFVAGGTIATASAQSGDDPVLDGTDLTDIYTSGTVDGLQEIRDVERADRGLIALLGTDSGETTILRIDNSGDYVNEETVSYRLESIARVDNHSYAAAGTRGGYAVLTRIHEDGFVEWTERFGGTNETDTATDVVSAPNGDAYLLASTESVDNETSNLWVLRVDDDGEVRWDRVVEGETPAAFPKGERLADGSLVTTIQTRRTVDDDVDGPHNASVARLAPDGEIVWQTLLTGTERPLDELQTLDVVPAHGEGVVLVGATNNGHEDDSQIHIWAAQVAPDGGVDWQRQYDAAQASAARSVVRSADGYVLVGSVAAEGRPADGMVLTIDTDGNERSRTLVRRNASARNLIRSVAWTPGGRLALGGVSGRERDSGIQTNAWVSTVTGGTSELDPGPSTWETQHSDAERAGQSPDPADSNLDTLLFVATGLSVVALFVPYGLRRFRGRR